MALPTGSKAPDFTLNTKTEDGLKEVKLSDNFGKKSTVLLFFPFAYTSVCTDEMCDVTSGISAYNDLKAEVYAISGDSPFAQEAWAKQNKIGLTILSDYNHEVAAAYDIQYDELLGYKGVAKRSAFVINQEGVVTFSWSSDNPKDLPDFEAVKAALKA